MNLKLMLTKKLGPLPAWGWGLVIGGGYVGYRILSGKGLSVTGAQNDATNLVGEGDEYAPPETAGPGSAYGGSAGGAPTVIINMPEGANDNDDLAEQLAKSKAYAKRMKERGDNWAAWGKGWKDIAKGRNSPERKKLAQNAKRGSDKPKMQNTGVSRRRGTQGTHRSLKPITWAPKRVQEGRPVSGQGARTPMERRLRQRRGA